MPEPIMTREQALNEVCGPGQPYELKTTQIRGKTCRVFVNAPLTLHDLYLQTRSDLDFLIYEGERLSYNDVYRKAAALAAAMIDDYGIRPGDRVAIAMRNYPEWVITFFATTSIGAIAVPVNAWWNARELAYSLEDCQASLIVADEERLERLAKAELPAAAARIIRVRTPANPDIETDEWNDVVSAHADAAMPTVNVEPDDDAIILYTSGSTGHPKGVVSSHRNIIHALMSWELDWELRSAMGVYQLQESDQQGGMLLTIPLFHVSGCHAAMLSSMRTQRKVVCMHKWDVEKGLELIERERLTGLMATPAISGDVVQAAASSKRDLSSLIVLGGGGAPRAPEQVKAINALTEKVIPATGWGMTETNAIGAGNAADDYLTRPASSGRCSGVLDMRIVDADGNECPTGERGELQIRGTSMFRAYWNNPEATEAAFDGDWFRTGDAAIIDEEGFLFIVDRIKDLVIRGGENIGCGAVEAALQEHSKVLEACVYAVPDERLGEEVGATVYVTERLDEALLREFLLERIAKFEIPRFIHQTTDPLPRIATGKIAKRQLQAEAIQRLGLNAA
ncbi:MAG: class I adenylate-forming enzyme family protein [Pseudomonadota bacterium]